MRLSNWTVLVSAWSSPVRLWLVVWVHHGRERPSHCLPFPDSLAAISGFAVTFGAIIGPQEEVVSPSMSMTVQWFSS